MEEELIWEDIPEEEQDTATADIDTVEEPISESAEGSSDLVWEDVPEENLPDEDNVALFKSMFEGNNYLTEEKMVDTKDSTTTMPPREMEASIIQTEVNDASIKSYLAGAKTLPIGLSVMAQDFANFVNPFDDEYSKEDYFTAARDWAKDNQDKIKEYNKKAGFKEGDIFTPDMFGQLSAELLTAPMAGLKAIKGIKWLKDMKTTTQAAIAEGGLATVTAIGENKTYSEAGVSGILSATGTKVVGEVLTGVAKIIDDPAMIKNIVTGKASDKQTLAHLTKASGETEDALNGFYQKYAEATSKNFNELTPIDKIQAIVKNSEAGGTFRTEAEYFGEDVLAKTNLFEHKIEELFSRNLKGANIPADKLDSFLRGASKNYGEIQDALISNFDTRVMIPKEGLEGLKIALRNASNNQNSTMITRVLEDLDKGAKEALPLESMFQLKRDLNSLNLVGVQGFKGGKVGDFIEELTNKHFMSKGQEEGTLATKLWKQANTRYSQKKAIENGDNWLTTLIQKKKGQDISNDDFANAINSQTERGAAKFNQLKEFIGEDGTAQVEKQIIKDIFSKKEGLNSSLQYIKGFEFVTEEGKQLRSELIRLEGAIPKESSIKLLQRAIGGKDGGSVGFSDNLISKAKYSVIGKTYNAILTRMPSATQERAFRNLGDVLKDGIGDMKVNIKKDPTLQKAFDDEIVSLRKDIDRLKEIGTSRTPAQNKKLAKSIDTQKKMKVVQDTFPPRTKDGTESLIDIKLPKKDSR